MRGAKTASGGLGRIWRWLDAKTFDVLDAVLCAFAAWVTKANGETVGSVILYCSRCWVGYASIGEIPARCPACDRVTRWATQLPADVPKVPWELSINDKRWLKTVRIQGDEPETHGEKD